MNKWKIKPGQRWIYESESILDVVEIIAPINPEEFCWSCKTLQVIKGYPKIGDKCDYSFESSFWRYLEGQDKLI